MVFIAVIPDCPTNWAKTIVKSRPVAFLATNTEVRRKSAKGVLEKANFHLTHPSDDPLYSFNPSPYLTV